MVLLGQHGRFTTAEDMGSFRIDVEIENPAKPGARGGLRSVLVDTGAELSCFPAAVLDALGVPRRQQRHFRQADGSVLTRWTGPIYVYAAGASTTDEVIFGEQGDLTLLGARSLEGLNFRVDPVARRLVDAGPMPLAPSAGNTARDSTGSACCGASAPAMAETH